ncbi:hypothetical protein BDR26DRAFT_133478 [Obelidium mucronatum]|nr:hypothetical protein BDR26DRAFT_133478 [Obelidium mucronatum]
MTGFRFNPANTRLVFVCMCMILLHSTIYHCFFSAVAENLFEHKGWAINRENRATCVDFIRNSKKTAERIRSQLPIVPPAPWDSGILLPINEMISLFDS